jgi:hypothetical protein
MHAVLVQVPTQPADLVRAGDGAAGEETWEHEGLEPVIGRAGRSIFARSTAPSHPSSKAAFAQWVRLSSTTGKWAGAGIP